MSVISNFILFRWIRRIYFVITNLFRRKRIAEAIEGIKQNPLEDPLLKYTISPAEKYKEAKHRLDECLYGTLVDRPPQHRTTRKRHDTNGWRHQKSHPFYWEGKIYDVRETMQESMDLYNELHGRLIARFLGGE